MSNQNDRKLSYLVKWTKKELLTIQETSRPIVCLQLKNGDIKVGTMLIENNNTSWVTNTMHFNYKKTAIYYSILTQLKRYTEADNLRMIDHHLTNLENEETIFNTRLNDVEKKRDWFKFDLIENRLSDIQCKIIGAKYELEKVISHATYLNRATQPSSLEKDKYKH